MPYTASMRTALLCVALGLSACSASRETLPDAEPPPAEAFLLAAALDPLGVDVLPPQPLTELAEWRALDWTTRYAIESADVRQHFLVRGDEVDVLIYGSERQAEGEARRIQAALGASSLTSRADSTLADAPVSYFVAGTMVVRHRGDDPDVEARLATAFGTPTGRTVTEADELGPLAQSVMRRCLSSADCPDRPLYTQGRGFYQAQYDYTKRLYQGEHVPAWTIEPRFNRGGITPQTAAQQQAAQHQGTPVGEQ